MKIIRFRFSRMHNAEHFQYMTEFKDLLSVFNPSLLKIEKFSTLFLELFVKEDECFMILRKSAYTERMVVVDLRRDGVFRILRDMVKVALYHEDEEIKAAAKRLKILFDVHRDLAQKPKDEETSGINGLLQELEGKFSVDIELIGGTAWVAELRESNDDYEALVKSRDLESTKKPEFRMRQVRKEIDLVYRNMTEAVEVLARLADEQADIDRYVEFIQKLNTVAERYKNRIAQRKGTAEAKKEKEQNEQGTE